MSLKAQMFGDFIDYAIEEALTSDTDAEAVVAVLITRAASITAVRLGMTDEQAAVMSTEAVEAMRRVAWRKAGS